MVEHTTRAFDLDLQELVRKIVDMGRSDDEQIANATEALLKRDTTLARRVIAADDLNRCSAARHRGKSHRHHCATPANGG